MQRYAIDAKGKWVAVPVAAGAFVRYEDAQALSVANILLDVVPGDGSGHEVYAKSVEDVVQKLSSMDERIEDLESDWQLLSDKHDSISRNCSAFENEMGNLQVENGKIREAYKGYSSKLVVDALTHERDTLRDVLALLAPDLKAMAILYAQQGDHTRSQALANICKSVGVL